MNYKNIFISLNSRLARLLLLLLGVGIMALYQKLVPIATYKTLACGPSEVVRYTIDDSNYANDKYAEKVVELSNDKNCPISEQTLHTIREYVW